jgi:uncharacterized Zn finger protein
MLVPNAIFVECTFCQEETKHRVIKGKFSDKKQLVLDAVVKCNQCQNTHHKLIKEEKPVEVPLILSKMNKSTKKTIEIKGNEMVELKGEYLVDGSRLIITAIETKDRRVESALAKNIRTLWAKEIDKIQLGVSINAGSRTLSRKITAVPDELFNIGDILTIKGSNFAIHRIKTTERILKKGGAIAQDIVRLYCKRVK